MGHIRRCRQSARLGLAVAVALATGCQEKVVKVFVGDGGTLEDAGSDGPGVGYDFGWGGLDLAPVPPPSPADGGPPCVPLGCDVVGGRYCGLVGDGCGGNTDCGHCPAGPAGGGETIDCGDCPNGTTCGGDGVPGVCSQAANTSCMPLTCDTAGGGRYCGAIGNGCGKSIDCGDCPSGTVCGGAGVANVCYKQI